MEKLRKANPGMGVDAKGCYKIHTSREIGGYEGILQRAINLCDDGCEITLDIASARALLDIVRQAKQGAYTDEQDTGREDGKARQGLCEESSQPV